ncbi:MAG: DUF4412 domain-containing protein [Bacteroidota bacterium]
MNSYHKIAIWIVTVLVISSLPAWSQFEGTFTTTTTGTREGNTPFSITQEVSIKGKKIRSAMTAPGEQMGSLIIIFRGDKGRVITILDQAKVYMELSIKTIEEMMKNFPHDTNMVTVTRTGKKQKILGYNCEQIILQEGEATIDIWGTSELTFLRKAMQTMSEVQKQKVPQWSKELDKLQVFPMKTIINAQGTNAEMTVTSIQRKSLPESIFNVPAGYKKQDLPAGQTGGQKKR